MKKPQISTIIVNYCTGSLIDDCIKSLLHYTDGISFEIIVVDNASPDNSGSFIRNKYRDLENFKYLQAEKNLGFGKANNLGYKEAEGDYIFLLNSDTIILNNALLLFYNAIQEMPETVGCIGTFLLERDEKTLSPSYGNFATLSEFYSSKMNRLLSLLGISRLKHNKINDFADVSPIIVDYVIGADLFIKRTVIEKYGLFDPDFFMYSEESEMQKRYKRNGIISAVINGPKIVHLTPKIDGKPKYTSKNRYLFYEGMFTYFKKDNPFFKYYIYRVFFFLTNVHQIFTSKGNFIDRFRLFLLFIGIKTIKH